MAVGTPVTNQPTANQPHGGEMGKKTKGKGKKRHFCLKMDKNGQFWYQKDPRSTKIELPPQLYHAGVWLFKKLESKIR